MNQSTAAKSTSTSTRDVAGTQRVIDRHTRELAIMTAFANGESVGFSSILERGLPKRNWNLVGSSPSWNWNAYDYKIIKPEPKPKALTELFVLIRKCRHEQHPEHVIAAGDESEVNSLLDTIKKGVPAEAGSVFVRRYVAAPVQN